MKETAMSKSKSKTTPTRPAAGVIENGLFERVVAILEQARANVVRAVNSNMVTAYWLIGKEIVLEVQGGEKRAEYGKQVIEKLAEQLTGKYRRGFSMTNLWYFRQFYLAYSERNPEIPHKTCEELGLRTEHRRKGRKASAPSEKTDGKSVAEGLLKDMALAVAKSDPFQGFSDRLGWSHYRALTKVENRNERLFYEIEAEKQNWTVTVLERQIHTCLFARLLKSRDKDGVLQLAAKGQMLQSPADAIKHPYMLDFLGLPDGEKLRETSLETAIVDKLNAFLLELGKGFAFVARQHRLETESEHFYIDLVFYNYMLKCFVLIDLKIGKLTHQDIGQMDMYVRMFDDLRRGPEDNPTIGLILCAERDDVVARYSVLKESKQLFASKYMLYLPTQAELVEELAKERRLIEAQLPSKQPKKGILRPANH